MNLLFEAFDQDHDVFLFQIPEHFDFSQSCFSDDVVVIRFLELLDGD